MVGHVVTSVGGGARLTMAATDDCTTDAKFDGEVTLVWDPQGSYSFSTALPGRMMGTIGGIVVSNGTFTVNGTNSFDYATSIEVADGASFAWASAKPFGLRSLTSLTLGSGASFALQSGAAFPFTTNVFRGILSLNLASGSSLSLPSGTVLPAVSVTADGVDYPVGTILSGDTGVAGTIYLPQLGAGVKVKVVESLACGTPVIGTDIAFEGISGVFRDSLFPCGSPEGFAKTLLSFSYSLEQKKALKTKFFGQAEGRTPLSVIRELFHETNSK